MIPFYEKHFKLGILGGGQLGRMLIQDAINYDIRIHVLDPSEDAPCKQIAHCFVLGDFMDYETVLRFGHDVDIITIEIEHVNTDALEELERRGKKVYPSPSFLKIVQDKGLQKEFYRSHEIPTAPYSIVTNRKEIADSGIAFPLVQKLRRGGYDGKGVQIIHSESELANAFDAHSVIEEKVNIKKEIAVIVARNASGEVKTFPLVEMEFNAEANLVEFLFSPASVSIEIEKEAIQLAKKIVTVSDFVGLLAVEMFVNQNDEVIVNEIAPRPHNSGHHTIEACSTSQYGQLLRAIMDMPLGDTTLIRPAVTINLLGQKGFVGPVIYEGLKEVLHYPGVHLHLYGKRETKPFRKMGHVTVTAENISDAQQLARKVASTVKVVA